MQARHWRGFSFQSPIVHERMPNGLDVPRQGCMAPLRVTCFLDLHCDTWVHPPPSRSRLDNLRRNECPRGLFRTAHAAQQELRPGMVKRREYGQIGMFQSPRHHPAPLPERITKNVPGRAVDVNRPVTLRCVPDAVLAARARAVTGGLTSPARLVTVGRIQSTKLGVLNTVSPSQLRPPGPFHGNAPHLFQQSD